MTTGEEACGGRGKKRETTKGLPPTVVRIKEEGKEDEEEGGEANDDEVEVEVNEASVFFLLLFLRSGGCGKGGVFGPSSTGSKSPPPRVVFCPSPLPTLTREEAFDGGEGEEGGGEDSSSLPKGNLWWGWGL